MPLNSSSSVQFGDIVLEKKVTIAALASETQAEVASCVFIYYIAMLSTLAAYLHYLWQLSHRKQPSTLYV